MCHFCLAWQCPWNYLGIEYSSEYRKKPRQKQDHCHHFYHTHQIRSCCKSLLFHWDLGRETKKGWKHHGFILLLHSLAMMCRICPTSCWRLQWIYRKPEVLHFRLSWTIPPALGSAPGGDGVLQADVSPRSVFMCNQKLYNSYEVGPVLEADIPNLYWHVGYVGITWGEGEGEQKPPRKVDNCQKITKCLRGHGAYCQEHCPQT